MQGGQVEPPFRASSLHTYNEYRHQKQYSDRIDYLGQLLPDVTAEPAGAEHGGQSHGGKAGLPDKAAAVPQQPAAKPQPNGAPE